MTLCMDPNLEEFIHLTASQGFLKVYAVMLHEIRDLPKSRATLKKIAEKKLAWKRDVRNALTPRDVDMPSKGSAGCWFELIQYVPGQWIAARVEPLDNNPPGLETALTPGMIQNISSKATASEPVKTTLAGPDGGIYEVLALRFSTSLICGGIRFYTPHEGEFREARADQELSDADKLCRIVEVCGRSPELLDYIFQEMENKSFLLS